mgnify:CR=1 FL=1
MQTFTLRDKVYDLVLEKFGLAPPKQRKAGAQHRSPLCLRSQCAHVAPFCAQTDELDLASPLEKALATLRRIQSNPEISEEVFAQLTQAVTYLGHSNILNPSLGDQFGAAAALYLKNELDQSLRAAAR